LFPRAATWRCIMERIYPSHENMPYHSKRRLNISLEAMCGLQGAFSVTHNTFFKFVQKTGMDSVRVFACSGVH
jgi:hypothetical protein